MNDLSTLLEDALARGEEGDFEGMAAVLREALDDEAPNPQVLCWLGVAERELGLDGVAYERFKQSLALEPQDAHVLATLGGALAHFDDPEAEGALRTAALTAPTLPLARWMYGSFLAREGMLEAAFEHLDAAVELAPDSAVPLYERGVAHALAGRMQRALDDLGAAAALDPDDGWTRVLLGLIEVEMDRVEEGAGDLAAGARMREDDVEAQVLAALASTAAGWDDQGYEMLERARIRAAPGDRDLIASAEGRIDEGPAAARELLDTVLGPSSLRERLMTRP